jgi:hypothetical protein
MLSTIGIGLCCIGCACAIGGNSTASNGKHHKQANARRAKNGFKRPNSVGAIRFENDLPWYPEMVDASATYFRRLGYSGDRLLIAVLRDVYPINNFSEHIAWPVQRSNQRSLIQERVRRHLSR